MVNLYKVENINKYKFKNIIILSFLIMDKLLPNPY